MTHLKTDILVVGSGLAGTLFSLELAKTRPDLKILIICNQNKENSSSYLAQGGIAAVLPESDDSMEQHLKDTLTAGAFTNNPSVVEFYVSRSPDAIHTLESWGVHFDENPVGFRALALEGGHSLPRVLHHKDYTGKHIMKQLHAKLKEFPTIQMLENTEVYELVHHPQLNEVSGAHLWDYQKQKNYTVQSSAVILGTGGVGSLFRYTTNPYTALGQGIALAEKAGAKAQDMMNIQFHPTALWKSSGFHLPLISEALRGAGAVLQNEYGKRFMADQHPLQDLAPRDLVARSIIKEIEKQVLPYVYLDSSAVMEEEWQTHFPGILKICHNAGINPRIDPIPVVPAAHYNCGGIATDVKGRTAIERLFILGETACTGLHGANRLASNSLLEATLMAKILAKDLSSELTTNQPDNYLATPPVLFSDQQSKILAETFLNELRMIMQSNCSVVKTTSGLLRAAHNLLLLEEEVKSAIPSQNIYQVKLRLYLYTAGRIVESSLKEKENKGVFYNQDLAIGEFFG